MEFLLPADIIYITAFSGVSEISPIAVPSSVPCLSSVNGCMPLSFGAYME